MQHCHEIWCLGFLLARTSTAYDLCAWQEIPRCMQMCHEIWCLRFLVARKMLHGISRGKTSTAWGFCLQEIHCLGFLVAINPLLGISRGKKPTPYDLLWREIHCLGFLAIARFRAIKSLESASRAIKSWNLDSGPLIPWNLDSRQGKGKESGFLAIKSWGPRNLCFLTLKTGIWIPVSFLISFLLYICLRRRNRFPLH